MPKKTNKEKKEAQEKLIFLQTQLASIMAEQDLMDRRLEKELKVEMIDAAKDNLESFFKLAWDYIEPGIPYLDNWHISCICDHLSAMYRGEIQNLAVEISPRSSKSSICNVIFPVWVWVNQPEAKFITTAAIDKLAVRDSVRSRRLMQTPWFQDNFAIPLGIEFARDQNLKTRYDNTKSGYRIATSIGGAGIGEGFDYLIVDDPHKPAEINSPAAREAVIEWWGGTASTRANTPDSRRLVIHQRLHEDDLIGYLKKNEAETYDFVTIPMEFEPERKFFTSIGWEDPRTEEGAVFWPERWPKHTLEKLKKSLGEYGASAQLQQNPVPKAGGVIKRDWVKYYSVPFNKFQLCQFELILGSWDLSFSNTGNSYCVGQVWGKRGNNKYLLAQYRDKMDVVQQLQAIRQMKKDFPSIRCMLIEKKANGDAVIRMLQKEIQGLIAISPQEIGAGDKEVRLAACSVEFESSNVWFPDKSFAPWITETVNELVNFPKAQYDDIPDVVSQVLNWLATKSGLSSINVTATAEQLRNDTGISQDYDWHKRRSEAEVQKTSAKMITEASSSSITQLKSIFG
jgi:predicted phage terminase large subunit-like protein